ncbi:preprotein translocase subunit SecD [Nocardiopsis sp. NPDC050513]|uniref:preprotein translocase subunit SecD n=1 Tax=Nocardiopsis sp. NPDC050513 TaxID=3364338 RepID=UPI00379885B9
MAPHPPTSSNRARWWLIPAFVCAALAVLVLAGATVWVLWLDRGETVVLRVADPTATAGPAVMDDVAGILGQRVAAMGAGEPRVTTGEGTVTVGLPRDADPDEAVALLERRGLLAVRPVVGAVGATETGYPGEAEVTLPDPRGSGELLLGSARMDNDGVESAEAALDPSSGQWQVHVAFTAQGADAWSRMTGEAACHPMGSPQRRVAVVLDGEVVSAPEVGPDVACEVGLDGGTTVVSGGFTQGEAHVLASLLRVEPLPLEVTVVEAPGS